MRLLRLELENWCSHQSLDVDLNAGLSIEGRNGTGKSSILEAIRFVFRETARGYRERVRNGERSACVRLTFESQGVTYAVEKRIYVDKASSAVMLADGVQVADNPSSLYQRLSTILPEDVLENLLYIPQGGLTKVLDRLSGKDGKLELDRLFGLDRLERVWEKAGAEVQEAEVTLRLLEDELKKSPQNAEELMRSRIAELSAAKAERVERMGALEVQSGVVKNGLAEVESRLKKMEEDKKTIDGLRSECNRLRIEDAQSKKEEESLEGRLERMRERQAELKSIEAAREGLARYAAIRELLKRQRYLKGEEKNLAGLGVKKGRLAKLRAALEGSDKAERELAECREKLKSAEADYATHLGQMKHATEHFKALTALDGQAKCPTCGQKLNAFQLTKEVRESAERVKSFEEQRLRLLGFVENYKTESQRLEADALRLRDVGAEARHLASEVGEQDAQAERIALEKGRLVIELGKAGYLGESEESVESRFSELNRLEGRVQLLSKDVAEAAALSSKLSEISERCSATARRIGEIDGELSRLAFSDDAYLTVLRKKDELSESRYRLESDLMTLSQDAKRAEDERADVENRLKAHSEMVGRVRESKRRLELLRGARDVFHRDRGVVRYLREMFIHKLNSLLTYHFKRFNQNQKYVDVSFDKDYNLLVRTTLGDLGLTQLSGGELAQLALALRIALIDFMSPIRLLMLDEPFGSLDEPHRELLGESLNKIAEQGQLILVTHIHVESLQLMNRLDLGGY